MTMTALRMAEPSRTSKSVTARSEPVLARSEASAGLKRTHEMASQPQEKRCTGLDRAWSHTSTLLSDAVAKRLSRQWWSIELNTVSPIHVLSGSGSCTRSQQTSRSSSGAYTRAVVTVTWRHNHLRIRSTVNEWFKWQPLVLTVGMSSAVRSSHCFTVLSPHEKKLIPSGVTVRPRTNPECAKALQTHFRRSRSQTRTSPSQAPVPCHKE
jgi:hypothetical protein